MVINVLAKRSKHWYSNEMSMYMDSQQDVVFIYHPTPNIEGEGQKRLNIGPKIEIMQKKSTVEYIVCK